LRRVGHSHALEESSWGSNTGVDLHWKTEREDDKLRFDCFHPAAVRQTNADFELIGTGDVAGVEGGSYGVGEGNVLPVPRGNFPFFAYGIGRLAEGDIHVGLTHYDPAAALGAVEVVRSDVRIAYQFDLEQAEEDDFGGFAKFLDEDS
jgi:hypothetical protein